MSDKNQPKQENANQDSNTTASSSNAEHSENQQGLSTSINLTSAEKNSASKNKTDTDIKKENTSTTKTNEKSKTPVNKSPAASSAKTSATKAAEKPNKLSKTAVFALLIALLAIAASAGHYFWAEQQKAQFSQQLTSEFQKQLQLNQAQVTKQLQQQTQNSSSQLATIKRDIQKDTESETSQLQQQLAQLKQQMVSLSQNQPSDWLLHEAEYLIRVASRSLWLEKDTTAAIGLLHDAERRIQELNDPQFLPLRQIIQQDIASLQLLPKLNADEVILKLMALNHQIMQLPFPKLSLSDNEDDYSQFELTDNVEDWYENLTKSLKKFTAMFLTVNRENVNARPLTSPEFKQNLRENLSLKLQTAIWAASKGNTEIYHQSLTDIQTWLNDYFDMTETSNQNFANAVVALKKEIINVSYPNKLTSLAAIRDILSNNAAPITPTSEQDSNVVSPESSTSEQATQDSENQLREEA